MANRSYVASSAVTRRSTLMRGVAVAAGVLFAPVRQAAAKMAQAAASYQDTPKGDQQCSNCSLFQPPKACQLIDGDVGASGWCKYWVKKPG
jgi:hypothetical protein